MKPSCLWLQTKQVMVFLRGFSGVHHGPCCTSTPLSWRFSPRRWLTFRRYTLGWGQEDLPQEVLSHGGFLRWGTPKSSKSLDRFSIETSWNPWFWGSPIWGNHRLWPPEGLNVDYEDWASPATTFRHHETKRGPLHILGGPWWTHFRPEFRVPQDPDQQMSHHKLWNMSASARTSGGTTRWAP